MLKIKIVHVVGKLGIGGAERYVVDLCNEMASVLKYDIYIISLCANDPTRSFVDQIHSHVNYISFEKTSGFSLKTLIRLSNWLLKERPHIVHTHLNSFEYISVYRMLKTRTSFYHTIHSTAQAECPNFLLKVLRKNSFKNNFVTPVSISNIGSKSYREYYGLNNDIVIHNARPPLNTTKRLLEVGVTYKKEEHFLLLHVGRISFEKNQELLINAVLKFNRHENKKCKLLIIGEEKNNALSLRLKDLTGGSRYIEFLGLKENIADYLSVADAFCMTSLYEGMPIALIEAMSMGCLPICTPAGGIIDMIKDGVTGYLSKDLTVDSYYKTLKRAIFATNGEKIKRNVITEFNNKYHIHISASKHLKTYQQTLNLFEGRDNAFELLYKSKFVSERSCRAKSNSATL